MSSQASDRLAPPPSRHRSSQSYGRPPSSSLLERRSRVNSSCGPRPVTGLTGRPLRTSADQGHHYGAGGPPRRRLNDTSSPSMKSDLQSQMRKWLRLTGFPVFLQIRAAAIMGKMGRLDVAKKPVLHLPSPLKVTVVRFGLRTAALVTHQRPLSLFPFPPKVGEKKVN